MYAASVSCDDELVRRSNGQLNQERERSRQREHYLSIDRTLCHSNVNGSHSNKSQLLRVLAEVTHGRLWQHRMEHHGKVALLLPSTVYDYDSLSLLRVSEIPSNQDRFRKYSELDGMQT